MQNDNQNNQYFQPQQNLGPQPAPSPQPSQNPNQIPQPTPSPQPSQNPNYDFILNPTPKNKSKFDIPKSKILIVGIGALILIIIFVVIKNLVSSPIFSSNDFLAVLKDQQEIIHLVSTDTTTNQEIGLLTSQNQNLIATTNLVISSDQQSTINYLKSNAVSFSPTSINLGINTSLDNQINSSINSNTYNQTLDQVLSSLFSSYTNDLKIAYNSEHGPKGKALLKNEYKNVYLLNKSLNG